MLNEKELLDKLYTTPETFKHFFGQKDYRSAALCADWAYMVAAYVDVDARVITELFGDRQQDEPIEGLINEERRIEASWWCVMHGYPQTLHTLPNIRQVSGTLTKKEH